MRSRFRGLPRIVAVPKSAMIHTTANQPPRAAPHAALACGPSADMSADVFRTLGTEGDGPNNDVPEARRRLRLALRAWAEVEKAKANDVARQQVARRPSHVASSVSVIPTSPRFSDMGAASEDDFPVKSTACGGARMRGTAAPRGRQQLGLGEGNELGASPILTTTPPMKNDSSYVSGTSGWIRNKRPKFWAIVYTTTPANDALPGDSAAASGRSDGVASSAVHASDAGTRSNVLPSAALNAPAGSSFASTFEAETAPVAPKGGKDDRTVSVEHYPRVSTDGACLPPSAASDTQVTATSSSTHFTTGAEVVRGGVSVGPDMTSVEPMGTRRHVPDILPFRNRYKRDVARAVADVLNKDPVLGQRVISGLSADSRRLMLVMGVASEYFGEDLRDMVEQVKVADKDHDSSISSTDYEEWARQSFQRRRERQHHEGSGDSPSPLPVSPACDNSRFSVETRQGNCEKGSSKSIIQVMQRGVSLDTSNDIRDAALVLRGSSEASPDPLSPPTVSRWSKLLRSWDSYTFTKRSNFSRFPSSDDPAYIPWHTYRKLLLASAAPFAVFGALDNSTFVVVGDAIDRSLSETFHLSAMAAAGLGGVVSGVAGIQVHGLAERWVRKDPPVLSPAQERGESYSRATHRGNTIGMVCGLILGMTPLLLLPNSGEEGVEQGKRRLRQAGERSYQRKIHTELFLKENEDRTSVEIEEERAWASVLAYRPL